jgi:hypothetical protein
MYAGLWELLGENDEGTMQRLVMSSIGVTDVKVARLVYLCGRTC